MSPIANSNTHLTAINIKSKMSHQTATMAPSLPRPQQPQLTTTTTTNPRPSSASSTSSFSTNNRTSSLSPSTTPTPTVTENTGRWTKDEHELFLQGLAQHGKEWKKIAVMIESRTVVQIRTHAQKYFQKIAKSHELQGKEVPGDLTSTAANPRPLKAKDNKPTARASKKYLASAAATAKYGRVAVGSHGPANGKTLTCSLTGAAKRGKAQAGMMVTPNHKADVGHKRASVLRSPTNAALSNKKLKISTNKIEQSIECQNDFKWFLASQNSAVAPDSSPTSVSEIFKFGTTFGGAAEPFADEFPRYDDYNPSDDSDDCILNSLETDSMECDWFSSDDGFAADDVKISEPLPKLSIDESIDHWVHGTIANRRARASSLDSLVG